MRNNLFQMRSKPLLILISGPPGVGKSTLSKALAYAIGATLLDKDAIDEPFSPGDRGNKYTQNIEPKVIAAMLNLAQLNLRPGHAVILDVPWTHLFLNSPQWRTKIRKLTRKSNARLLILECQLPEYLHKKRMKQRGLKRDKTRLTPRGWKIFKSTDRLGEPNPLPHQPLDMRKSPETLVREALKIVRDS